MIELRELSYDLLTKLSRCTSRNDLRIILPDHKVFALEETSVAFGFGIRWMNDDTILNPTTAWSRYCLVIDNPSELNNPLLLEYRCILIDLELTLPLRQMTAKE